MNERGINPSEVLRSVSVRNDVPDNAAYHTRQYEQPTYLADMQEGISSEEEAYPDNRAKPLRPIEIEPISSGFLVRVGCQRIAIETPDKLIYMLTKYLTDPTKFESEWYSKDVINRLDNIK